MAYQYPAMVAWNPGTSAVVKATVFQVYAPGDTSFVSPLAITDPLGNALANLNSGSLGVFPAFAQAQYATVVVSDVPNHTYAWTVPASQVNPVVPWAANTYYTNGQPVVNPSGDTVTANVAHTSASTYDSTKWNYSGTFVSATSNYKYSKAKTDGTDQSSTIQGEINSLNSAGGGTLILPAGTIIAAFTMANYVSVLGRGKKTTIIKPPSGSSALGAIMLPVGPVQDAWLSYLSVAGNGNAGQHGIFFQSQGQAVGNNGGWWNSGMESVLVSGFTGDQIWLMGGGTNALTPHQFLTFKDVEAYIPSSVTRVALRMTGQVGQVTFLGHCEFDGPAQSNAGTNVDIRRQTDINLTNLSDQAPYTVNFIGTTFQSNQSGVHVERAAQVVFDRCHLEAISQGFSVDTSAVGVFLNECIFGTVGVNAGNGYAVKASGSSSVYSLNNVFTSTPDKHFVNSYAYLIQRGTVTSNGAAPITSGLTSQYSIAADGSLSTGLNTQAVVNGNNTVAAPSGLAVVGSGTGGTLAAGATYWKVTATYTNFGESAGSNEVTYTAAGTTSSAALSWTAVSNAASIKVYRGTTAGGENVLVATLSGTATSYTDTGATGSAASPPATGATLKLITLTNGLGVGETLTIKALSGTVVVDQTGNIDPAGKTMPYTIPSGASMTFQKQDLLGTPWFIQAASA